jgi:hypothetical protein
VETLSCRREACDVGQHAAEIAVGMNCKFAILGLGVQDLRPSGEIGWLAAGRRRARTAQKLCSSAIASLLCDIKALDASDAEAL